MTIALQNEDIPVGADKDLFLCQFTMYQVIKMFSFIFIEMSVKRKEKALFKNRAYYAGKISCWSW